MCKIIVRFLFNRVVKLFAVGVVFVVNVVVACQTEYYGGTAGHRRYVVYLYCM